MAELKLARYLHSLTAFRCSFTFYACHDVALAKEASRRLLGTFSESPNSPKSPLI